MHKFFSSGRSSTRQRSLGILLLASLIACWTLEGAVSCGQDSPVKESGTAQSGAAQSDTAPDRTEKGGTEKAGQSEPAASSPEGKLEAGLEAARKSAGQVTEALGKSAQDIGQTLNQSKTVQDASTSLLKPIYDLSQYMAHPWFYWLAFALMVAGVVSFAGQVVLTKLLLLFRMHLNFKEILSDVVGLLISLVGLVLTTQAATQNSTFTSSPAAVLSSAAVGVVMGILFYLWGQGTEFNAARRSRPTPPELPRK